MNRSKNVQIRKMENGRNIKKGIENKVNPCCTLVQRFGSISVRVEDKKKTLKNGYLCAFTKENTKM